MTNGKQEVVHFDTLKLVPANLRTSPQQVTPEKETENEDDKPAAANGGKVDDDLFQSSRLCLAPVPWTWRKETYKMSKSMNRI